MHNGKNLFCKFCYNTHHRITWCKKRHESDDQQRLALFLCLLHERTQVLIITFQHYQVTQRLVVHNSVGNKTKSIRPSPRLRPVWDRSCHKTAVSDPMGWNFWPFRILVSKNVWVAYLSQAGGTLVSVSHSLELHLHGIARLKTWLHLSAIQWQQNSAALLAVSARING